MNHVEIFGHGFQDEFQAARVDFGFDGVNFARLDVRAGENVVDDAKFACRADDGNFNGVAAQLEFASFVGAVGFLENDAAAQKFVDFVRRERFADVNLREIFFVGNFFKPDVEIARGLPLEFYATFAHVASQIVDDFGRQFGRQRHRQTVAVFISAVNLPNFGINFGVLSHEIFFVVGGVVLGGVVDALQTVLVLLAIFDELVDERILFTFGDDDGFARAVDTQNSHAQTIFGRESPNEFARAVFGFGD